MSFIIKRHIYIPQQLSTFTVMDTFHVLFGIVQLWTVPHFVIKMYKSTPPLLFFYCFLFIPVSTAHKLAHKQKAHVIMYKVEQRLLCAQKCFNFCKHTLIDS